MSQGSQGQWPNGFYGNNHPGGQFAHGKSRAGSATYGYDAGMPYSPGQFPAQANSGQYYGDQNQSWSDIELPPATGVSQQGDSGNVDPSAINQFVRSRHDEPWSSYGANVDSPRRVPALPSSTSYPGAALSESSGQLFGGQRPRTTSAFSASDSGYASLNVTCGPSNHQSLAVAPHPWQLQPHASGPYQSWDGRSEPESTASATIPGGGLPGEYLHPNEARATRQRSGKALPPPCIICGKQQKNPSEAFKHSLQHEKPHRCREPGCTRAEGFATENDLQRHRMSVHHQVPSVGRKNGYMCAACAHMNPTMEKKFWPRKDNFRAHIRRKHAGINETELLDASECERPPDVRSESGYGSALPSRADPHDLPPQQDLSSPLLPAPLPDFNSAQGETFSTFGNAFGFDELAGIGEQMANPSAANREPHAGIHGPSAAALDGLSILSNAATAAQLASPADSVMRTPEEPYSSTFQAYTVQYQTRGQERERERPSTSQWHGDTQKQRGHDMTGDTPGPDDSKHPDGDHVCPECGKRKKRECDLRKHSKRHSRPYGCTFPHCWKRFGSRNDWKRHENSQHFLQEMWRCNIPTGDNNRCGKLAYSRELFCQHLRGSKHGITDTPKQTVEDVAETMRLGREGHHLFWCGFCNDLQQQPDRLRGAWDHRFKHIGDHYDKLNANINDWICLEANKKKGLITKEERKAARKRAGHLGGGGAEEDSDLGEDGIPSIVIPRGYAEQGLPKNVALSAGHDVDMISVGGSYASNKRRREDTEDAEGESDEEYSRRGSGGFGWSQ